jgi:hypothetical protein
MTRNFSFYGQRFSPNSAPTNEKITDVEILTIYFYCRRYEEKHKKSAIYDYVCCYMAGWFPKLPNYSNFNSRLNQTLMKEQNTYIYIPVKLIKGQSQSERQFNKAGDGLFPIAVSRVRQPIESLFNWINEKIGLQNAAKARATKGLMVYIFGALVTAPLHYVF